MAGINVSILVMTLYYSGIKYCHIAIEGNWVKDVEDFRVLFLTMVCESVIISIKNLLKILKDHILDDPIYMKYAEKANPWRHKVD